MISEVLKRVRIESADEDKAAIVIETSRCHSGGEDFGLGDAPFFVRFQLDGFAGTHIPAATLVDARRIAADVMRTMTLITDEWSES